MISAIPAGILEVPTPKFLMTVGNNSAVYNGIMTFAEDTENLPAITNDSETHFSVSIRRSIQLAAFELGPELKTTTLVGSQIVLGTTLVGFRIILGTTLVGSWIFIGITLVPEYFLVSTILY
jgi:hypothetical protein